MAPQVLSFFLLIASTVYALSWTATPFNPPSYPLAVRSPYLSAWLAQGGGNALNEVWPSFWTGATVGWAGFLTVDGQVYSYLGSAGVSGFTQATQTSATFTSTQSIFVLTAGPVDVTVTFLSPVEPTDLTKLSLPFSYMAVSVQSNDGNTHQVSVYSDISAEWVSGDSSRLAKWSTTTTGGFITHQVQQSCLCEYQEINDQSQDGAVYYSIQNSQGVTYQTGEDTVVRSNYISNSSLPNTQDTLFRSIDDNWPVFAFTKDIGAVGSQPSTPVVFSIGHVRDPAIQYIIAGGEYQNRSLYFWTQYPTVSAAISAFHLDYEDALSRANVFDAKVEADASKISSDYAAVVALSIRQALGAFELTVSKDSHGRYDTSDILMFLKEISSDGNVNTVDVIFPGWPALLYLNPELGKYLLLGLFQYQATGQYPNKWSVHDLGAHYPRATGHNTGNDEAMPVEESGNMLIMTLSYTQKTNDTSLIRTYTSLLDQWTQYLIADSLIPQNQLSTDDFAGTLANQTNLAIKGIVGIKAMAEIYTLLGDKTQAANYSAIVSSYVPQFQGFATSSSGDHLTLNYGNDDSWGLTYNLYGDKLLGTNVFPESIYTMQTAWYKTVTQSYGVPLDTRHTYTKSDWQMWTAAIMTDTDARDIFVSSVAKYAADGLNSVPLSDWYDTITGAVAGFQARPVVGGHLALLAL